MAKRPNQRLKLLYLAKIMLRLTDDEHGLQVEQIINELAKYDIAAERIGGIETFGRRGTVF